MHSVILLGAPGSGKGTIASMLAPKWNVPHISTGDLFREAIKNKTDLGLKVEELIKKGELVPDALTIGLVKERFSNDDVRDGYILDGFPRTIAQADALELLLKELNLRLDSAILLDVPDTVIIDRITGRRVCPNCGKVYHIRNIPPKKEGICDLCGAELVARKDDTEDVVRERLAVYYKQTKPLIDYYNKRNLLKTVDATVNLNELLDGILS